MLTSAIRVAMPTLEKESQRSFSGRKLPQNILSARHLAKYCSFAMLTMLVGRFLAVLACDTDGSWVFVVSGCALHPHLLIAHQITLTTCNQITLTMLSPYRNRNSKASGTWVAVTAMSGEIRGTISFEASLRAKYADNKLLHVKGNITLERWSGSNTQYRLSYHGYNGQSGNEDDNLVGTIALPRSNWRINSTKAASDNMKARLLMINFDVPDSNDGGLKSIQVTMSLLHGGKRATKTVVEAFRAASVELDAVQAGQEALVGKK
jgi:hypothetical protein